MFSWLKKSRLIRFSICLVVFTGIIVALLGLKINQMSHLIPEKKGFLQAGDQIKEDFDAKLREYKELKEREMDKVFQVRPRQEQIVDILSDFEELGEEYDLEVRIDSVGENIGTSLVYGLDFQGNFKQMIEYINKLENLPYYLRINSVKIDGVVDREEIFARPSIDKKGNVSLKLTIYLQ